MPRLSFALAGVLLAVPLLSCGAPVDRPEPASEAVAAQAEDVDEEAASDGAVPEGAFATIDALCAAQRDLVVERVAKANAEREEMYEGATHLEPSCEESPAALADASVHVGAPFDDVRAIVVETGHETRTHLVVHAADGWRATQKPVASDDHDDPGCPSIRRDGPLREIRVDKGALIIVGTSNRGEGEEEIDGTFVFHSRVFEDAFACRLARGALRCDESVTLSATLTSSDDRPAETIFATSYAVDDAGHIRPAEAYVDSY